MVSELNVIDSHTGGEPTRIILAGMPPLKGVSPAEKLADFKETFDYLRTAVVLEPRGSDPVVGALLLEPSHEDFAAGVIFFNNASFLGMCGHGTIGLIATLKHLGQITTGRHRIETPIGEVAAELHPDGSVSVQNRPAYRLAKRVSVHTPELGHVIGDVAWGGNWFFLVEEPKMPSDDLRKLTDLASSIRCALSQKGITGANGAEIDHIEFYGPPQAPGANSRNFVLCPGNAYDRSPCGTGTSAKVACLAADGLLVPGETYVQESIIGSLFGASYQLRGDDIIPTITGTAFITGEAKLIFREDDPFRWGLRT